MRPSSRSDHRTSPDNESLAVDQARWSLAQEHESQLLIRIVADLSLCEGWAQCVARADDYFDIDDSQVVLLRTTVEIDDLSRVKRAVDSCPVNALALRQDNDRT